MLGYQDRDVAIVPAAVVAKDGSVNRDTLRVISTVTSEASESQETEVLSMRPMSPQRHPPDQRFSTFLQGEQLDASSQWLCRHFNHR